MTHLAHTLKAYQRGESTFQELLRFIDQLLEVKQVLATDLLAELNEEAILPSLPVELVNIMRHRIKLTANYHNERAQDSEDTDNTLIDDDTLIENSSASSTVNATPQTPADNSVLSKEQATDTTKIPPAVEATVTEEYRRHDITSDKEVVLSNRFELIKHVGTGGMSTVYMALDNYKLGTDEKNPYVAIKLLKQPLGHDPRSWGILEEEAKKSQNLSHPNIIEVHGLHRDDSTAYLAMEYLSGRTLKEFIRSPDFNGLALEEALPIINAAGNALAHAHQQGIIHYDFKPANVFITSQDEIKVIDFGIARAFQLDSAASLPQQTLVNALTPAYASPEMLEHREPDQRDDVYALACTTYELLTGNHPFNRKRATEARDANQQPIKPRTLSPREWRALLKALSFDRNLRTPTVVCFLDELNHKRGGWRSAALVTGGVIVAAIFGWLSALFLFLPPSGQPPINPEQISQSRDNTWESQEISGNALQRHSPPPTRLESGRPDPTFGADTRKPNDTLTNASSVSAMMKAVKEGDTAELIALLDTGVDIDARDQAGDTSLISAARTGNKEVVEALLKRHAEVNPQNYDGRSALISAAEHGHTAILESLLKASADPNSHTTYNGKTALMLAAANGYLDCVQTLLQSPIVVNEQDARRWTALMYAAWGGYDDIALALVEHGADPNLENDEHHTAANVASHQGNKGIESYLEGIALSSGATIK